MKLLILSQWVDYLSTNVYHYSISKGFNLAGGFCLEIDTYYMTLGLTQDYVLPEFTDNEKTEKTQKRVIHLINVNEITSEFLEKLDYILFIKEVEMFSLLEKMPALRNLCLTPYFDKETANTKGTPKENSKNKTRSQKIGVKSDSLGWIRTENAVCKQLFGFDCNEFASKHLDLLYVQTPEFKTVDFHRFGRSDQRIFKKIVISPMGVNNYIEKIQGPTPYGIDHQYCVKIYDPKVHGHHIQTALYPIPIIPFLPDTSTLNAPTTTDDSIPTDASTNASTDVSTISSTSTSNAESLKEFNSKKTILIYSGRLKMDGAIDMLKNIMKELGNAYELHIFPGSFNLPASYREKGEENVRYSGKHSFSVLRDRVFNDSMNVIVHHPFTENEKGRYLTYADIGLDFCQSRPSNVKSCQGNCKLLEYCYYGLKVVAEKNINNSHLVRDGKNGILLDNIGTVQDYVKAIKEMEARQIDSEFTKLQTIKSSNWDIIAKGILEDFRGYKGL